MTDATGLVSLRRRRATKDVGGAPVPVTRRAFIETYGCQMNVYDSDQIERVLAPGGYTRTAQLDEADLVVVNTCAIRAKAEQKAFSFVGRLTKLKQRRPDLMVAVGGCVAQQEGEKIFKRIPFLDLVFGTQAIDRLPSLIQRIDQKRCRIVDIEQGSAALKAGLMPGMFVSHVDGERVSLPEEFHSAVARAEGDVPLKVSSDRGEYVTRVIPETKDRAAEE